MSKIAVYGINGLLGVHVINALLSEPFVSKLSTPIRLVTSSDKSTFTSDKVEYVNVKDVGLNDAFEGVDVVINLNNFPHSTAPELIDALKRNNVKLYIPSQFGTALPDSEADFPGFLAAKEDHSKAARAAGIKTVDVYTGLFVSPEQLFLGAPFSVLNFDAEKKEVEIVGDENTLINPSFLQDIGKVVASLVTKEDYSTIPDHLRTYSGRVTLGDLVAHYEKQHSVTLLRKLTKPEDILKEAKKKYENFSFADFLFYLKALIAAGEGRGLIFENNNDREFINPGESLFKWTKYTI